MSVALWGISRAIGNCCVLTLIRELLALDFSIPSHKVVKGRRKRDATLLLGWRLAIAAPKWVRAATEHAPLPFFRCAVFLNWCDMSRMSKRKKCLANRSTMTDAELADLGRGIWDLRGVDAEIAIGFALKGAREDAKFNVAFGKFHQAEDCLVSLVMKLMLCDQHRLPKVMHLVADELKLFDDAMPKYDDQAARQVAETVKEAMGLDKECSFELCFYMGPRHARVIRPKPAACTFQGDDWQIWLGQRLITCTRDQLYRLADRIRLEMPMPRQGARGQGHRARKRRTQSRSVRT